MASDSGTKDNRKDNAKAFSKKVDSRGNFGTD